MVGRTGYSTQSIRWCVGWRPTVTTSPTSPASMRDRRGDLIRNHKIFLTNGHDEYWSGPSGRNVGGCPECRCPSCLLQWQCGLLEDALGEQHRRLGTPYRTLVCYKETHNYPLNPDPTNVWTGTWRDPRDPFRRRWAPRERAERDFLPESMADLHGCHQRNGRGWQDALLAQYCVASLRGWPDHHACTRNLGCEVDVDDDNGYRPAGVVGVSTNPIVPTCQPYAQDYGTDALSERERRHTS